MTLRVGLFVFAFVFPALVQSAYGQEFCAGDKGLYDQGRINTDLESKLYSLFVCRDDLPPGASQQNDVVACNWFVGQALAEIWGRNEFFLSPAGRYMITSELAAIQPDGWVKMGWTDLGFADNQDALASAEKAAFDGNAVIALRSGHVALVLPGGLANSPDWKLNVPRAAQLRINDIDRAFVGCRLSRSWKAAEHSGVRLLSAPRN